MMTLENKTSYFIIKFRKIDSTLVSTVIRIEKDLSYACYSFIEEYKGLPKARNYKEANRLLKLYQEQMEMSYNEQEECNTQDWEDILTSESEDSNWDHGSNGFSAWKDQVLSNNLGHCTAPYFM